MDYRAKYLKYKKKYLDLIKIVQDGGYLSVTNMDTKTKLADSRKLVFLSESMCRCILNLRIEKINISYLGSEYDMFRKRVDSTKAIFNSYIQKDTELNEDDKKKIKDAITEIYIIDRLDVLSFSNIDFSKKFTEIERYYIKDAQKRDEKRHKLLQRLRSSFNELMRYRNNLNENIKSIKNDLEKQVLQLSTKDLAFRYVIDYDSKNRRSLDLFFYLPALKSNYINREFTQQNISKNIHDIVFVCADNKMSLDMLRNRLTKNSLETYKKYVSSDLVDDILKENKGFSFLRSFFYSAKKSDFKTFIKNNFKSRVDLTLLPCFVSDTLCVSGEKTNEQISDFIRNFKTDGRCIINKKIDKIEVRIDCGYYRSLADICNKTEKDIDIINKISLKAINSILLKS